MQAFDTAFSRRMLVKSLTGIVLTTLSGCSTSSGQASGPTASHEPPAADALTYARNLFVEDLHLIVISPEVFPEYNEGFIAWQSLDYHTAAEKLSEAYEQSVSMFGAGAVETACIEGTLGCLYLDMARYDDAYDALTSAFVTMRDTYGEESDAAMAMRAALASHGLLTGDYDNCLKDTTSITETSHNLPIWCYAYRIMSCLSLEKGQIVEAIRGALTDIYAVLKHSDADVAWQSVLAFDEFMGPYLAEHAFSDADLRTMAVLAFDAAEGYQAGLGGAGAFDGARRFYGVARTLCEDYLEGDDTKALLAMIAIREGYLLSNSFGIDKDGALVTNENVLTGEQFLARLEEVRESQQTLFGWGEDEYPGLAETELAIADTYGFRLNDQENALKWYEKAISRYEQAFGHNHPKTAQALYREGNYYGNRLLDFEKSIELMKEAVEIRKNILVEFTAKTAQYYLSLSGAYRLLGNEEEAQRYRDRVDEIHKALGLYLLTEEGLEDAASKADEKGESEGAGDDQGEGTDG
ncbi:MAG: tetratricopeptide repeat protein [Coriobacteriales bacterium]|nr:tetratricopeptide repeat protein [Coriobacteriales bacterium]